MQNKKPTLLLVDDEIIIIDLLESYLDDCGFDVISFTDSVEALANIKENHYDIILTDLMMPDVTGMDIVREVFESDTDTKVLLLTGFASVDSAIEGIQLGVYDYIRKPFKLDEINVVLNRAKDQLCLERDNIALNKQVTKMLSDMTMIHDISSILYQVPDFDSAMGMVLDTLTEGLLLDKAAVFSNKNSNQFSICASRGISDTFIQEFKFNFNDILNGEKISISEPTLIHDCEDGFILSDNPVSTKNTPRQCALLPIRYFEKTLGYLGVFQTGDASHLSEDEFKLLSIMATQIAPIFKMDLSGFGSKSGISADSLTPFQQRIDEAKSVESMVSFALIRPIVNPEHAAGLRYEQIAEKIQGIISEANGESKFEIWQNFDSWIFALKDEDTIALELTCAGIRNNVEDAFNIHGQVSVNLVFAAASYPQDGHNVEEVFQKLSDRFFQETVAISE